MDDQRFRGMVARLELEAAQRPALYRYKTLGLALLGYVYIYGVAIAAIWFGWHALHQIATGHLDIRQAFFGLVSAVLVATIARASWMRFSRVPGTELNRGDAPELFRLIDKVRKKVRGPKLHRVVINDEFNAGISQRPRLGPLSIAFGLHENTLVLGLPYMMAAGVRGFAATLAHEYGHLAGSHGKVSAWLYRLRQSWQRLLAGARETNGGFSHWFYAVLNAYAPYFLAYSFVLARQQEYEADRVALDLVGAQASADDLVMMSVASAWLREEFWPTVYRGANNHPVPQETPYRQLQALLKRTTAHPRAQAWLTQAMARISDVDDTHPSLRDRLDAIQQSARLPPPIKKSAAELLFGTGLPALVEQLDRDWYKSVRAEWKARHEQALKDQEQRARLRHSAHTGVASSEALRELAALEESLNDQAAATAVWQRVIEREARDAPARYHAGRLLLAQGEERGIALLEQAVQLDADAGPSAFGLIADWLEQRGREREASHYRRQSREHARTRERAERQEGEFTTDDQFERAPVTQLEWSMVRKALEAEPAVSSAHLVRKLLPSAPNRVFLVLALELDPLHGTGDAVRSMFGLRGGTVDSLYERVAGALKLNYPFVVVPLDAASGNSSVASHVAEAIRDVAGSVVK